MRRADAIVIGADIGGLAASAYLVRAGLRVLVLETRAAPPEPFGALTALDPPMLADLGLEARGLRFVRRDLPLAAVWLGEADARAWAAYREELFALGRRLGRWWRRADSRGTPEEELADAASRADFARLCMTGAQDWLAARFHADALIAALLFDATMGGFQVSEPGSALALVWRASQQVAAQQGATAVAAPGTLVWSLIKAASAADFRCYARVTSILTRGGAATGVRLANGEEIAAPLIFSSLSRGATATLLGMAAPAPAPIGEARLLITWRRAPDAMAGLGNCRLVLADSAEIYAGAHEAARAGRLADEIPLEMIPLAPDRIAVTLRPVPALLPRAERIGLAGRAVHALQRRVPGAAAEIGALHFTLAAPRERANLAHLLAPPAARVGTPVKGLYLCGAGGEPLACLSGQAARIAVELALGEKK